MTSVLGTTSSDAQLAAAYQILHFAPIPDPEGTPPPVIVRGEGCYVEDSEGNRFLDGLAGLFAVQLGYNAYEELGAAAVEQMRALPYFSNWGYTHPPAARLAAKLAAITPGDLTRSFFISSGSEAVESAWKLAQQYHTARGQRRWKVVARRSSYHGTTAGALSITGVVQARAGFDPHVPEVVRVDNTARHGARRDLPDSQLCELLLGELETAVQGADPETVAMVIAEPVQTAGGSLVPPDGYFAGVRELCDRHGILLCADEVLNGFGRLGEWFGSQRLGFTPDLLTCAKGISSGYAPMAAVVASEKVADAIRDAGMAFNHGSTFGGHPVAAAVSLRNLELFEEWDVIGNVRANEQGFRARLEELLDLPGVRAINGLGYLLALELSEPGGGDLSESTRSFLLRERLAPALRERGLICRLDDRAGAFIQLAPPLVAGSDELDEIAEILRAALTEHGPGTH